MLRANVCIKYKNVPFAHFYSNAPLPLQTSLSAHSTYLRVSFSDASRPEYSKRSRPPLPTSSSHTRRSYPTRTPLNFVTKSSSSSWLFSHNVSEIALRLKHSRHWCWNQSKRNFAMREKRWNHSIGKKIVHFRWLSYSVCDRITSANSFNSAHRQHIFDISIKPFQT